jgi:hypothetical protein
MRVDGQLECTERKHANAHLLQARRTAGLAPCPGSAQLAPSRLRVVGARAEAAEDVDSSQWPRSLAAQLVADARSDGSAGSHRRWRACARATSATAADEPAPLHSHGPLSGSATTCVESTQLSRVRFARVAGAARLGDPSQCTYPTRTTSIPVGCFSTGFLTASAVATRAGLPARLSRGFKPRTLDFDGGCLF